MDDNEEIVSVDQLPDDPLKMPPPYWRSGGAIFHVREALQDIDKLIQELILLHPVITTQLNLYFQKYPEYTERDNIAMSQWADICDPLRQLEHKIKLKAQIACLMSAIQAEENLNEFCVFNLHCNIAETIEKLAPPGKMLVACSVLGHFDLAGTTPYQSMQKLIKWRNAFAHGHCVDRPTKSPRHNHLIHPATYPGVKSALGDAIEMARALLDVVFYLCSISLNWSTQQPSAEFREISELLEMLCRYVIKGNEYNYQITIDEGGT